MTAIFEVELPDGNILEIEAPANTPPAQIKARANAYLAQSKAPKAKAPRGGVPMGANQSSRVATGQPVSPVVQYFAKQAKGRADALRAFAHNFAKPFVGAARFAINKDAESGGEMATDMASRFNQWADKRESDYQSEVPDSFASGAGALLGNLALPVAKAPQALGLAGKVLAGAGTSAGYAGAINQANNGETGDLTAPAVLGGSLPVVGRGFAKVAKGGSENIPRMTKGIIAAADKYGIPVYPHQISDSRLVKTLSSSLGEMPFSGAQGYIKKQADAYTKFVSSLIGKDAKNITPRTIETAKQANSALYDASLDGVQIPVDTNVFKQILAARNSAGVSPDARQGFDEFTDYLLSEVNKGGGALQGRDYQVIRQALVKSTNPAARTFRKILEINTEKNMPPDRLAMFKKANEVNTNIKAVEKAMKGADTANAKVATEGTVNPATFRNAVDMKYRPSKELQYAAKIGQKIKDPIANSGTFARGAIGVAGPLLGATGVVGGAPALGTLASIMGLSTVGGATAGRLINSPLLARYMVGGAPKSVQKAAKEFEKNGTRYAGALPAYLTRDKKDKK